MWTRQIMGVESYYVIQWFFIYSILGWCVESAYMSLCNRKWTNRGFVKGPICPIYGFGAVGVYFLLQPVATHYPLLYICGAVAATCFEYLVAKLMQRIFGQVWWDYHDKPFNYKGIICLESSLAWGLYTIIMFGFLQGIVERIVGSYTYQQGVFMGNLLLVLFLLDLGRSLYLAKKELLPYTLEDVKLAIQSWIYG